MHLEQAQLEAAAERSRSLSNFIPGLQTIWDSTTLTDFKDCPRKYAFRHLLHLAPKNGNPHLIFGAGYHAALEEYDKAKSRGDSEQEAQRVAVRVALDYASTREADGQWLPWASDHPKKSRAMLVRAVVWYLDNFADDPLETVQRPDGTPAVELSFKLHLDLAAPDGEPYVLSGHIDRVVDFNGQAMFLDRKTTGGSLGSHWAEEFHLNHQIAQYNVAANIILDRPVRGGIIDGAQLLTYAVRFQRFVVQKSQDYLDAWLDDQYYWLNAASAAAQVRHWPAQEGACHKYGGCPFRAVCGASPARRPEILAAHFERRVWDPAIPRNAD